MLTQQQKDQLAEILDSSDAQAILGALVELCAMKVVERNDEYRWVEAQKWDSISHSIERCISEIHKEL